MWFAATVFYVYAYFRLPSTKVELMFAETLRNQEIPEHAARSVRRKRAAAAAAGEQNGGSND
jgi:hypothetical protein